MNTATLPPQSRALLNGTPPEFNIVMIYEDGDAGRRAKRFSDKLLHEIGCRCQCVRNLWSFDVLAITNVRNAAAGIARAADLVIVSTSGERELSPHIEKWLDLWAWLIDGTNPALVALFENANGEHAGKIRWSLRGLAAGKRLPFFAHTTFEPSADLVRTEREYFACSHHRHAETNDVVAKWTPLGMNQPGAAAGLAGRRRS
jgi:hypothetical protein